MVNVVCKLPDVQRSAVLPELTHIQFYVYPSDCCPLTCRYITLSRYHREELITSHNVHIDDTMCMQRVQYSTQGKLSTLFSVYLMSG